MATLKIRFYYKSMEKCKHNAEIEELHDDSLALFQVTR